MHLVTGRCDAVIDGCPVPWEEVHAVLEYPSGSSATWQGIDDHVQQLEYLDIAPAECEMDHIAPMVNGKEKVLRLVHPCGVRYAVVVN